MFGFGKEDDIVIKISSDIKEALVGIRKVDVAIDKMDANVGKAAAGIRGATGKMIKAFTAVGVVATIGMAVAVGKATMTFADFEQAVTNAASVTGQTGDTYEATKRNIEELSKTLGETTVFSAQEAANAMYDLASAGYDVGTMVKSDLEPIMNLAAATQTDLTFATETVTSTLGQFSMGIEDSSKVSDIFAKTIGSSKATLDKLALSMRYVGPVAHSIGMDIADVNAMLGQLYNAGFKGEQAGTALRTAMARLMVPTKAINDILASIGLTYDQVNPATNDFADTLALLAERGLDTNAAMQLFGIEAAPAMVSLMANTEGVRELEATLRDAGGAAADMATKQLDTLQGSLTLLKSAFEGLMISVGEMAAPAVKDFAVKLKDAIPHIKTMIEDGLVKLKQIIKDLAPTWENLSSIINSAKGIFQDIFTAISGGNTDAETFTEVINTLTGALAKVFTWIDKHPEITKLAVTIGLAAVAFAYILPIVVGVVGAVSGLIGFIGALAGAIGGATTVIGAISAVIAVLGGPITVIIGIIALLAAAWTTNFFGIRDKTKLVIDTIKPMFLNLTEWIGEKFEEIKEIFTILTAFIEEHKDKIIAILGLLIPPIGAIIYAFNHWDEIKEILSRVTGFVSEHKDKIITILKFLLNPIGSIIKAFKNWDEIKEIVTSINDWLTDTLINLGNKAKDWGKNLIQAYIDGIKSKITAVKDAVNMVADAAKDFIGISSPAKKGPLSELMEWGPNLTKTFAEGIKANIPLINTAMKDLSPTINMQDMNKTTTGAPITNIYNIQAPITIKDTVIREEADIDRMFSKIETTLAGTIRSVKL